MKRTLIVMLSALMLALLCACGGPIHEEIETAKANIASSSPKSIARGWVFLAQNQDDEEAQEAIESFGGLPTPFTNLEELYRMGGTGRQSDDENRDAAAWVNVYLNDGLDVWGENEECDTSNPYVGPYCEQLFGTSEVSVRIDNESWYLQDGASVGNPSFFELWVQGLTIPADTTDDEVYGLLDSATSLAGLGEASSKSFSEGTTEKGNSIKLWYTHEESAGGTPWYAILRFWENEDGRRPASLQIFVSDCFSPNASNAIEEYAEEYAEEYGGSGLIQYPLFSGHQEKEEPATSLGGQPEAEESHEKDELVTDVDGKQVWKVWTTSSTIHFTGSYQGQGNFIVKVLDGNQDLEELVCNEIGDWTIDKSVSVTPGKMYYVQIEWSRGSWTMQWTGTGGA